MNPPEISDVGIRAAGAVLWRPAGTGCEVALVHRPKYGDWTIPKGKIKRREHLLRAARREVFEETGVKPLLGRRLAPSFYDKDGRGKRVDYWAATAEPDRPIATPIEDEIDGVEWLPPESAARRLSYERDRLVLADFVAGPRRTVPLILLRHAATAAAGVPDVGDDELRPLNQLGRTQAASLAKLLSCFGSVTALAATTVRAAATLIPYATRTATGVTTETALTTGRAEPGRTESRFDKLLADPEPTIVCGDEDLITRLLVRACERLGGELPSSPRLPPAGFWVLHLDAGRIAAIERHRSPVYAE